MRGRAAGLLAGVYLVAGLFAAAPNVYAQSPPLGSIPPEAFTNQPAGIRSGDLLFHGYVTTGTAYDSNIFSTHDNATSDRILFVRPGLVVSTLDPNYRFTLRGYLEDIEYEKTTSENRLNAHIDINGKVRVN